MNQNMKCSQYDVVLPSPSNSGGGGGGPNVLPPLGQHQQFDYYQDIGAGMRQTTTESDFSSFFCKPKMKLEMEEFKDLSPFLPRTTAKIQPPILDELNTPVFERKGPFDFSSTDQAYVNNNNNNNTINYNNNQPTENLLQFKIKTEQPTDCCNSPDYTDVVLNSSMRDSNEIYNTISFNDFGPYVACTKPEINNEKGLFSPVNSETGENNALCYFDDLKESPTYDIKFDEELDYLQTVGNLQDILYSNSEDNTETNKSTVMSSGIDASPDDNSNHNKRNFRKLKLNFNGIKMEPQDSTLSTPDVIQTIADIENDNFNILDVVSDKEITYVSLDDLDLTVDPGTSHARSRSSTPPSPAPSTSRGKGKGSKQIRRRRRPTEDDEDYVPPTKLPKKGGSVSTYSRNSSDYEDSDDEELERSSFKRGRPRKRGSISSESSKGSSEAARYRELRDKNNEASRKSRLKRKMKEMSLADEAEELEKNNVKLKAEVETLERTVNNFRNNLFEIMLKK